MLSMMFRLRKPLPPNGIIILLIQFPRRQYCSDSNLGAKREMTLTPRHQYCNSTMEAIS